MMDDLESNPTWQRMEAARKHMMDLIARMIEEARADEREQCAAIADEEATRDRSLSLPERRKAERIAERIRARGGPG